MSNGDGDAISGTAATAIVGGVGLIMAGALISGLTLDFGRSNRGSEVLRYRLKIIALSGPSLAFGTIVAGGFIVGVALLFALALANGASPGAAKSVRGGVTLLGGLLALLTLAALVVDLTFLSEDDVSAGGVAGTIVGDLGALAVAGAAAWAAIKSTREAT